MLISNIYFKVYTHFNLVPDCFLIFWFCIKGNQVYYTWMIYTPVILVSIQLPFSHWNMGFLWSVFSLVWAELYPYFPIFGRNLKFCPSTGKCGYNSVHIWENKDQRLPIFRHISRSVLLNIFSHNLDLSKNISIVSTWKLFIYIMYILYIYFLAFLANYMLMVKRVQA